MAQAQLAEGKITDQALRELAELVGKKLRINAFNTYATLDTIRHFVDGIGDTNPLWRDPEYSTKTEYRTLPAPPSWIFSVFPTWVSFGLRGVHSFHSGTELRFHKPVLMGDKITPEFIPIGFRSKLSKFAGVSVIRYGLARYYNQKGELVADAISWSIRAERAAARERGKYSGYVLPHPWTQQELMEIEQEILSEQIRGSVPRYWEDVELGEELKLVRGPLGMSDMIAYVMGANPVGLQAFRAALVYYKKHPAWAYRSPTTSALEPAFSVHFTEEAAKAAGVPYPYDIGVQRHCLLINMLTNWMGDSGWIKLCYAEYRKFWFFSDVLWFKGKVVKKFLDDDGEPCVAIETHAYNQRGEDTMPGYSVIVLPSKEYEYWPVRARLTGEIGIRGE